MGPSELLMIALSGASAAAAGWWLTSVAADPRTGGAAEGRFEAERRQQLRAASPVYRFMEPWIDELAAINREQFPKLIERLRLDIPASGSKVSWRAAELVSVRMVEALGLFLAIAAAIGALTSTQSGLMFGGAVGLIYYFASISDVKRKASKRRNMIRRRFASAFDLVALMLDVGATFPDALKTVAEETKGHPLGDELERLLQNTEMGGIRADALKGFGERLADEDIQEMMSGIVEAEDLGTPIVETMHTQIEQIRQKRVHWAEKTAEEAKVQLVFPAMVIMIACLIIVAAPFILSAAFAS